MKNSLFPAGPSKGDSTTPSVSYSYLTGKNTSEFRDVTYYDESGNPVETIRELNPFYNP